MAYNLPPAWDAGYALPSNVRDEGLERRAFVTKQMPRGSYDAPRVGTAGYAVPDYVKAEGYGQGTFVTDWQPSGTYSGPRIPHFLNDRPRAVAVRPHPGGGQVVTIQRPMSGLGGLANVNQPLPAPFVNYGRDAANAIMSRVAHVTPSRRKAELRRVMDAIDPTLWKRTAANTRAHVAGGVPPAQALHAGLARALATGLASEIIQTGKSKTMPKARSLLGLGCYNCSARARALGDAAPKVLHPLLAAVAEFVAPKPSQGQCDATGQTFWNVDHWERLPSGQACVGANWGSGVTTTVHESPPPTKVIPDGPTFAVGPWLLSDKPSVESTYKWTAMTPEQRQLVTDGWTRATVNAMLGRSQSVAGQIDGGWTQMSDLFARSSGKLPTIAVTGTFPVHKFKNPSTGEEEALYYRWIGPNTDPSIGVSWHRDPGILEVLWDALVELISAIVMPILNELGDLACKVVGSDAGKAGAVVAGGIAGGPAGATAAGQGAQIGDQLCKGGGAPPPPSPASSDLLPVAIIGGAALAAVLILRKRK